MSELAAETTEAPVTDLGSGVEAGSGPVDGTASAAPNVETPVSAPARTPDNPDFQQAVAEQSAQVAEARVMQILQSLQEGQGQQQQGAPDFQLDPYADDFGTQLQQFLAFQQQQQLAQMQQMFSPLLSQQQNQVLQEGTQRIHDIVDSIATRDGDFTSEGKSAVADVAPLFLDQMEGVYGPGPRAAEAAIQQAAKVVRGIETAAAAKAVEAYKNQLSTVSNAPGSVGQSGASGLQSGPPATNLRELGRRFANQVNG